MAGIMCHEYQFAHIIVVDYIRSVFLRIVLIAVTTDNKKSDIYFAYPPKLIYKPHP